MNKKTENAVFLCNWTNKKRQESAAKPTFFLLALEI